MSEILHVFLKLIPGILFEAIAVAGVLGILLAAFFYAKRPFGKFYWLVFGAILFMLIWRLAIQIVSSRYAEILLYPAVIASVYACFKVPELIYPLIKKYIPEKIWRFLPYALIGGLCIACFCRAVRLNPYDPVRVTADIVQEDIAKNGFERAMILAEPSRAIQYAYYADLPAEQCHLLNFPDHTPTEAKVRATLNARKRDKNILYVFSIEKTALQPLQLKVAKGPDPRWKFLGQEFVDRRKKKVLRVYRYQVK